MTRLLLPHTNISPDPSGRTTALQALAPNTSRHQQLADQHPSPLSPAHHSCTVTTPCVDHALWASTSSLPLGWQTRYNPELFYVDGPNREAFTWVNTPASVPVLWIWGPEGAGKTHLAHIWGRHLSKMGCDLVAGQSQRNIGSGLVIDGLVSDTGQASALAQWWTAGMSPQTIPSGISMKALLDECASRDTPVLITSRLSPAQLCDHTNLSADLITRLKAAVPCAILPPTDTLWVRVLAKNLEDLGIALSQRRAVFLLRRMPRSFASVTHFTALIQRLPPKTRLSHRWLRWALEQVHCHTP